MIEVHRLPSMKPQRSHNPNVGDFISSKLREIDNDPAQPPYDSIQEYAYEGEGSVLGLSLSSIDLALSREYIDCKKPVKISCKAETDEVNQIDEDVGEDELELEYLNRLGPKFSKISNLFSGVEIDEPLNMEELMGEKIS